MPLLTPRNEKVGFWWILGQGDILVTGDLSWAMYHIPPRIGIFYAGFDFTNLHPPSPEMKKLDFGSR